MADDWEAKFHDEVYKAKLRAFSSLLLDLRPFWPRVVPLFVSWMQRQFESEGRFWNTPWAPLSPEYAARKAVTHPGKGILVADGDLRREASTPARRVTRTSLTLTIRWRKPARRGRTRMRLDPRWHQLGTQRMPARPLLSQLLPLEAQMELEQLGEQYVEEMAQRVGL